MTKKNKKISILVPVVIGVLLIAATGTSIGAYVYNQNKTKENNAATVSVSQTKLKDTQVVDTQPKEATTVEIQMDDTAMAVGSVLKLAAIVTPADTDKALIWSSSNTAILEVTDQGVVTVKDTGTAVITATVGAVSDAVIIEGIHNIASGSDNHFPVYIPDSAGTSSNTGASSTGTGSGSSDNTAGQNSESGDNGSDYTPDDSSDQGDNNASDDNSGAPADTSGNGTGNSVAPNQNSDNGAGYNNTGTNSGNTSSQVSEQLPAIGFSQILSNVYSCEENGVYYGEVIVQPNVTIVYIKQRSASFDAMIQRVITDLVPESASQVWSNYLSASTDRTFSVEGGRRVRIVVAANGGHSQIVIYN